MSKDNNYHNVIRDFSFAIFIALFIGATSCTQTQISEATAQLAVLSEDFSDDDIDECRRLIESDADVSVRNKYGVTPLWMASQDDHAEVVKLLLAANADVNAADTTDGVTPLDIALQQGHSEIVRLLKVLVLSSE